MAKERSVRVSAVGIIVQDGETLRQTAAREVKEETDAEVEVERLLITAESAPFEVKYVRFNTLPKTVLPMHPQAGQHT